LLAEAGTVFGGYTEMYPGYAGDMKKNLTGLGASETLSSGEYDTAFMDPKVPVADIVKTHRSRAKTTAADAMDELERTDILYFRDHHYGRYRAPGVFASFEEDQGFDLRYIETKGGFKT